MRRGLIPQTHKRRKEERIYLVSFCPRFENIRALTAFRFPHPRLFFSCRFAKPCVFSYCFFQGLLPLPSSLTFPLSRKQKSLKYFPVEKRSNLRLLPSPFLFIIQLYKKMCINPPFSSQKEEMFTKTKTRPQKCFFFCSRDIYSRTAGRERKEKRNYLASRHKKILSLMTTIIAVTGEETEMEALCSLFYILCIFSFEPPQWFVHLTLQRYFAFSWTKKKEKKFDAKNPLSPSAVASPPPRPLLYLSTIP